jgi:hypothetical protein
LFSTEEYTLQPSNKNLIKLPDINEERFFQIFDGGIIVCHAKNNSLQFDSKICDLQKYMSQGDTLIFASN